MTVNLEENNLERAVAMLKAHLKGLSYTVIGERNNLSRNSAIYIIEKIVKDIVSFLEKNSLYVPEQRKTLDRVKDKDFWLSAVATYVESFKQQPITAKIEAHVIDIGVTEKHAERLKAEGVINVGDLLDAFKNKKESVYRACKWDETQLAALERKVRKAGFDPYGGKEQITVEG